MTDTSENLPLIGTGIKAEDLKEVETIKTMEDFWLTVVKLPFKR